MNSAALNDLLEAAQRSLAAWSRQADSVQKGQARVIANLRRAIKVAEGAMRRATVVDVHSGCGGVVGYDAWVDSNSEVCGGPFDHHICMKCEEEGPDVTRGIPEEDNA